MVSVYHFKLACTSSTVKLGASDASRSPLVAFGAVVDVRDLRAGLGERFATARFAMFGFAAIFFTLFFAFFLAI